MRLPDEQLDAILEAVAAASTPLDALIAALRQSFIALGAPDISEPHGPRVDGRDYPLASDQWQVICQALVDYGSRASASQERVNLALDWMNLGPSGEQPASV